MCYVNASFSYLSYQKWEDISLLFESFFLNFMGNMIDESDWLPKVIWEYFFFHISQDNREDVSILLYLKEKNTEQICQGSPSVKFLKLAYWNTVISPKYSLLNKYLLTIHCTRYYARYYELRTKICKTLPLSSKCLHVTLTLIICFHILKWTSNYLSVH